MAQERFKPLLDREFLKAELHYEFRDFRANGQDDVVKARVADWHKRTEKKETKAEASFIQRFFVETWAYREDGTGADSFHLRPKFAIAGAGQTGNRGEADLAIGHFGGTRPEIPQVVCEFKDVKSGLDKPQNRKGNNRSPVQQAKDYLWNARRGLFGNEPVQPRFAIVTDMNEFRLYWWDHFPDRYLRFKIDGVDLLDPHQATLLGDNEDSAFDRFLFWRLFQPDMLLSDAGRTRLERLIQKQGKAEEKLEGDFYQHYRGYREVLIRQLQARPPEGLTKGGVVRLGQKLLDRLIFIMFAEDMGQRVGFPAGELQQQLKRFSEDAFLEPQGDEVWRRLLQIFNRMNTGGDLGGHSIHRFNGGLFADDPAIDGLSLPNHIFVARGQGQNDAKIAEHKETLFFLSATYNFAREGDAKNSIGLYTLGHIFEQSIVELEKLEADAEGRTSLTDVTKRKRDGVYYTPEWAVRRIIEETVDPLFASWKAEAGWPTTGDPAREAAAAYWERLQKIRILDPACGSGAFLIVALKHLESEFAAAAAIARQTGAIDRLPVEDEITSQILANNLFGVDINPASVEITKLSLWLHTAMPNKPLSGLDDNIQCGNSLVDKRFYNKRRLYDAEEQDRINTFDWEGKFALGSFDAVIGNPPYVEKKNLLAVNADMALWLEAGSSGATPYLSTTNKWDLYLPFIEKGLSLLNDGGRMGYIAPNLWPTLEYGAGLRSLVHGGRNLEKWLDFRSHQVFEEATVYTAIQIFSKAPVDAIQLAFAPDGDISRVDWTDASHRLPYADIPDALASDPWLFAPMPVRRMVARLSREALRLDQPENVKGIIVGIQTSADHIFHLQRLGRDRYSYVPRQGGKKLPPVVVDIEDAIMKPLVSGTEAKRFIEPRTDTFLLFPYTVDANGARLLSAEAMADGFPKAWTYLRTFETELRAREGRKFDDDGWYRMGRNQNLDKQEVPKILVPRLVARLGCFVDDRGRFYCDNVDVGGVVPQRVGDIWLLAGIINAPVTNTIFEWLSKPFRGGYKSANKQFIAPLPIPKGDRTSRVSLSALAKGMQERRTMQVDKRARLEERLAATARENWPLEKLLSDVRPVNDITAAAPKSVPASEQKAWVDTERAADEEAALARIDGIIRLDSEFAVILADGKLALTIDEQEAARVYVTKAEAALVEAQWRCIAIDTQPTGKGDAKRLVQRLRRVATRAEPAVAEQIIAIGKELAALDSVIRDDEAQLHEMTCALFNLSAEERALVEGKRG
jgi:hypothetical protein